MYLVSFGIRKVVDYDYFIRYAMGVRGTGRGVCCSWSWSGRGLWLVSWNGTYVGTLLWGFGGGVEWEIFIIII